ncbi:MAG: hypothetical protein H6540_09140 [Bacteroidales bacterium]|nr:hypothetical protein [Bacteroidales bacterium]
MKSLKTAIYLLAVSLVSLMVSCTSTPKNDGDSNVKHFRHIQFSETAYDITKGIYPISDEEAKTVNNFTFTYNEAGKPVSIAYMRGDKTLGYSGEGYARTEFSYNDSTELQTFFDENGNQIEYGGVYTFVYKLDENGNRIGLSFLDKEGNPASNRNNIAYYVWKVLPDGMVQEKRYNKDDVEVVMNPNCPFYELRFSYDKNGYCVRLANYMADTLYDCTEENCGEVGVSYFLFTNNDKGGLTDFAVYNSHGQMSNLYSGWSKFQNTLDENGNVVKSFFWDQDNEPLSGKRNPLTVNKYDEHGALIERQFMDKDENLVVRQGPDAAVIKYTYDETGSPVDTAYFDASMAAIVK